LLRRIALRPFLDGVYTVGIESDVVPDRGDGAVRRLIGPDSVDRTLSPQRDAVVSAVTLVWAVRGVVGSLEQRGVHVLEWNILNRRVARFAKSECRPRISYNTPRDHNDDAMRIALDRDRMVWPWDLDGLRVPVGSVRHGLLLQFRGKLDPEFLDHGLRFEIGGPERDGLAVPQRPVVNDLNDRVGPSNTDVEYRRDVAILGNDGVVAEPREIEHVGNTWQ
jgi:hypothetical protein